MSAAATTPDPTEQTSRVARLLDLVRKLIDYGKEVAATLHQRVATDPASVRRSFGTGDLTLILSRIARGLLRANALEARLVHNASRLDPEPRRRNPPAQRRSHVAVSLADDARSRLASLPTPEQIAAEVRRRPIGAVIADICRDLGIMPCHPLWRELSPLIIRHGGSLATLVKDILDRALPIPALGGRSDTTLPTAQAPSPLPAATGPP
jgi:hypothetical protein